MLELLYQGSRKLLLVVLFGVIGLTITAVIVYFLVLQPSAKQLKKSTQGPHLVRAVPKGEGDNATTKEPPRFLVPNSRIPKTQKARYEAPAITLVAANWQRGDNLKPGPDGDPVATPTNDRDAMTYDAEQFLRAWETFTPPSPKSSTAEQDKNNAAYVKALRPWVSPGAVQSVAQRDDNRQDSNICPFVGCNTGSRYFIGEVWNNSHVRFYDGNNAYITTSAEILYVDPPWVAPDDRSLNGTYWTRSYGLLMRKFGSQWLVTRAAADTVERIPG